MLVMEEDSDARGKEGDVACPYVELPKLGEGF